MRIKILTNRLIIMLITIALFIRIINPSFGSPVLYVIPDEVPNYIAAWLMLANKTLITSSQYPPLGSYIMLPFFIMAYLYMRILHQVSTLMQFQLFLVTHEGYFMFIPRLINVGFTISLLLVIYKTSLLIFPMRKFIALLSIIFISFSITFLQVSVSAKPWITALFFYSLSNYFGIKYYKSSNFLYWIIACGSLFVALGFHFSAIFGVIFLFLLLFYQHFLNNRPQKIIAWLCLLLPFVGLFLFYQTVKSNYGYSSEIINVFKDTFPYGIVNNFISYVKLLLLSEPIIIILMFFSLYIFKTWSKILKILFIYIVLYFLIIVSVWRDLNRYLLPIIIYLPLFSTSFIYHFITTKPFKKFRWIIIPLLTLTIIPGLYWIYIYNQTPTFIDAYKWINQNIQPNIPIASTQVRFSAFIPTKSAIKIHQLKQPGAYKQALQLLPENIYIDNVREIYYLEKVVSLKDNNATYKFLKQNNVKYLIDYYWDPEQEFIYKLPPESVLLVKRFSPTIENSRQPVVNLLHGSGDIEQLIRLKQYGPYVEIYELKY